eukprot:scaffold10715_cov114-Isochrysis_galbana.AAC.24
MDRCLRALSEAESRWLLECSVDSFSCDSKGGCSSSQRGSCCTHIPCLEPELWQVVSREPAPAVRCARPWRAQGCRAGGDFVPVLSTPRCCLRGLA